MGFNLNGFAAFGNGAINGYQLGRQLKQDREEDELKTALKNTRTAKDLAEARAQQEQAAEQAPIDQQNQAASASRVAESITAPGTANKAANGLDLGTSTDWDAEAVRLGAKAPGQPAPAKADKPADPMAQATFPGPKPKPAAKGLAGWQDQDGSAKPRLADAKPRKAEVTLDDQLAALEEKALVYEQAGKIEEAERVRDLGLQRYAKAHEQSVTRAYHAYQKGDTTILANFLDNDIHDGLKYHVERLEDGGAKVRRVKDGQPMDEHELSADQVHYIFGQMKGPEAAGQAYGAWQNNQRANRQMDLQRSQFDWQKDMQTKAYRLQAAAHALSASELQQKKAALQKQRDLAGQYNRLSAEERAGPKGRQIYGDYLALNGSLDVQAPDYKVVTFETPTPDGMGVVKTPAVVNMRNPAAGAIPLNSPGGGGPVAEDPASLAQFAGNGEFRAMPPGRAASTGQPGRPSQPAAGPKGGLAPIDPALVKPGAPAAKAAAPMAQPEPPEIAALRQRAMNGDTQAAIALSNLTNTGGLFDPLAAPADFWDQQAQRYKQ